jgi:predicted RNA binding protein YcfA (HicA-like mRNA interferase family)
MVFFQDSSYKKVKSVLEAHGFLVNQGGNHAKAYCNEHQTTIIFPRHGKISPGVMNSIVKSLVNKCHMEEDYLKRRLK